MAVPLWRQYRSLPREDREAIFKDPDRLDRIRRFKAGELSREDLRALFAEDERQIRERYRELTGAFTEDDGGTPIGDNFVDDVRNAGSSSGTADFASPSTIEAAQRLGIQPRDLGEARNRVNSMLESAFNRRQQTVPASQRQRYTRPSDEVLDAEIARLRNR